MAKALLRFAISSKSISTLSKPISSLRLCHTSLQAKEPSNTVPTDSNNSKNLFELIRNENNPISLLSKIEENKNQIDGRHVVVALESMQKFYELNAVNPEDVHKSVAFVNMCSLLQKHLLGLDMLRVVQALKILNLLKVPSSTVIIQSLLQLIRQSVNDLNLNQIYYLTFLFKNMESTNLSEAINTALPEVFKANYALKLDKEDLNDLRNSLRYVSDNKIDTKVVYDIVEAVTKYPGPYTSNAAVTMLWSLADLEVLPINFLDLLNRIYTVIERDVTVLKKPEVMKTIIKICDKTMEGHEEFYNVAILNKSIVRIIDEDFGFDRGITVLNKLNQMNHINIPLLDYLSSTHNLDIVSKYPASMVTLIRGLACANYKPSNWDDLKMFIRDNYLLISNSVLITHVALYLASLGFFDSKMLQLIFTSDQNPKLLSDSYRLALKQLYQSVKTLYPEYSGPWPMEEIIQSFTIKNECEEEKLNSLSYALERVVGGTDHFKMNVLTALGHEIDYLIVLQDGRPIVVEPVTSTEDSNSPLFVENLNIPADCEKVAVLLLPRTAYGRNIRRLNAKALLNIRSLEAMSFKVFHTSVEEFFDIPDFERLAFLMESIGINKNKKAGDPANVRLSSSRVEM